MKKRVLILYISRYSGHYYAAEAIEEGIKEFSPDTHVEKMNALDYTNPVLGRLINRVYLQVIKRRPHVWGDMYDNPSVLEKTRNTRRAVHRYNMHKIKKMIAAKRPDVVLCTQAFPCGMVADYKVISAGGPKLIGVLTDYAPHSYWLHDAVDHYVVPDEKTGALLAKKGIASGKINPLGIPVSLKFRQAHDRKITLRRLGLIPERPTILMMGGSQGLGPMEELLNAVTLNGRKHFQAIVVTGRNMRLFRKLVRASKNDKGTVVLPFADNVDELMDASDIIVSKAGGLTTAEALSKKLPMVIIDPIPGHERRNADHLVAEGAAAEVFSFSELKNVLDEIFERPERLSAMRESAGRLSKPLSSLDIAKLALGVD
ncbi:MAG: glycosyltransferase [Candidatus Omnitrophica bacterium]|nr:glycosyltransferase [Candidatus Omnitrophota bacterium]MDD4012680.1 glycosyltransferase [Candidatus Omnitrophota bacterium]